MLTPLRRAVLRNASTVLANSEGLRELSRKADPTIRVEVIPNGVDTEFFSPSKAKKDEGTFRFLFVGRLNPQKNLHNVLEHLFAEIKPEPNRPVELHIVGDGPERES